MRGLILMGAICMQLSWSHGYPDRSQGVGAFAYQDSAGNRYGGTYGLKDGQVFGADSDDLLPFASFGPSTFHDLDDFFPEYFRNLQNLLQETFQNHLENQRLALNAAKKAYDLTSNQAGYIPNFASRFGTPFGGYPGFYQAPIMPQPMMPGFGPNSAFAAAQAGPGFRHQVASINPSNPQMPNVDVTRFSETVREPGQPQMYSVSSSSYSSSSNVNGKQQSHRGAETVVNDNGRVTAYRVNN